jgi:hypothetical protein
VFGHHTDNVNNRICVELSQNAGALILHRVVARPQSASNIFVGSPATIHFNTSFSRGDSVKRFRALFGIVRNRGTNTFQQEN